MVGHGGSNAATGDSALGRFSGVPGLDALLHRAAQNGSVDAHLRTSLTARQRALLEIVNDQPALNIRELAERLDVQRTAAKHHVSTLLRAGLLATVRQGRHVLHFTNWMSVAERKALAVLRIGSVRSVVALAFASPGITTRQLAEQLGISQRTVRSIIRLLLYRRLAHLEKRPGTRAPQVHLESELRLVWARWFDPARDRAVLAPEPLQGEPSRIAVLGLFLTSWFTAWWS
ncbi:MAG TPA: winged helix-turn-helix transcriptional regulator [Candidatus Thermoplasmatota archaeon]|nr:winged helix-turn-helix transcriptional regulator [Candidatus Thermoplasmatota archaeon]